MSSEKLNVKEKLQKNKNDSQKILQNSGGFSYTNCVQNDYAFFERAR